MVRRADDMSIPNMSITDSGRLQTQFLNDTLSVKNTQAAEGRVYTFYKYIAIFSNVL